MGTATGPKYQQRHVLFLFWPLNADRRNEGPAPNMPSEHRSAHSPRQSPFVPTCD